MVEKITDESFELFISSNPAVVVDCYADWCGPCRMMNPVIDALSEGYNGKIVFGKLNVDENREISAKYSVMSIPTLLIFKNKTLMETVVGAVSKEQLKEKLGKYL
ncbi:MAG: thioredoxin [Euryarchaeota archaeon CG01_land_8_20_14_3_00_38_12]|nr:MAG: thioredoxin [Euryarchaeota archaeon CG01_land_8_20_14_3_00_38_12]PJB21064.1 MAG: thioredoxin [Euryarchaeota archaeon CG_4_9_14_3_um_filter_38_12]